MDVSSIAIIFFNLYFIYFNTLLYSDLTDRLIGELLNDVAEALAEHIAAGAFVMSADGSDAFAATVGPNGDFTKTIRTIYRVLGLMIGLIALFLALYISYIYATREVPAHAAA